MKILLHFFFMLQISLCIAQTPITFEKVYGTAQRDYGIQAIALPDSGYAFVGTSVISLNNSDIFLYRLNKYGDTLWLKKYGGPNGEGPTTIIHTTDNGFFILGSTSSYGADVGNTADWYAIKIDSVGTVQWTKTYGVVGNDGPYDAIQTSDGGYLMVGYGYSGFAIGKAIKTDAQGNVKHQGGLGGGFSNSVMHSCIEKTPGLYTIAGKNFINDYDVYVCIIDSSFNLIDDATYRYSLVSSKADVAYKVLPFQDGYLVAIGAVSVGSTIFRLNSQLDTTRAMRIPLTINMVSYNVDMKNYDMAIAPNNKLVFTAEAYDASFNRQVVIFQTDTLLNIEWTKFYGSATNIDQSKSIALCYDNGFIVGGTYKYSQNIGSPIDDYYIIKTDSIGNQSTATSMINDNTNVGIKLSPNPTSGQFTLSGITAQTLTVNVYNAIGECIVSQLRLTNHIVEMDLRKYPAGVYFIQVIDDKNNVIRKKLVKT
jgi:Secretion system C-terminal sorting domain